MKIIILTHGNFSQGILSAVELILGKQENVFPFSVLENCNIEELTNKLKNEIDRSTQKGEEVLFLTDVFFGTPFNIITQLMKDNSFTHITGINLPLLLEIISNKNSQDSPTMLDEALILAKEALVNCTQYFQSALED